MSIIAPFYLVLLQNRQNFRALIPLVKRGIVQKAENRPLSRRLQRGLQPSHLSAQHLGVLRLLLLFPEPPPGSAQGILPIDMAVVMQQLQRGQPFVRTKGMEFCGGGPPVIVVALEQVFPAGKAVQKTEVRLRLPEVHAPGGIPR